MTWLDELEAKRKAMTPGYEYVWGNGVGPIDPPDESACELVVLGPPDAKGNQSVSTILFLDESVKIKAADAAGIVALVNESERLLRIARAADTMQKLGAHSLLCAKCQIKMEAACDCGLDALREALSEPTK